MNAPPRSFVSCLIAVVLALATVGSPGVAQARITKVQITTIETPTFGGYSWPGVGQYEKIVGKAFGESARSAEGTQSLVPLARCSQLLPPGSMAAHLLKLGNKQSFGNLRRPRPPRERCSRPPGCVRCVP